ncbi:MAG: membrane-binding protein [Clostridiales bacterium]|jgi:hypothetical protein|nr:membrane-binding protein [Clostridiales bacterium]
MNGTLLAGIQAPDLEGITSQTLYSNGQLKTCRLNAFNAVDTPYGRMVPSFSPPGIRNKDLKSLSFYESGSVRSISLDAQVDVMTPMGSIPAELVTFYEDGLIEGIFPLNGQIGFGWSEEEEKDLAPAFDFSLPCGEFTAKPIALRFYPSGALKSLVLWPGEIIPVTTPIGKVETRIGFRLYEDGSLESVEPAYPTKVNSPVGLVKAYDISAVGVEADFNSLRFGPDGALQQLATSGDAIIRRNDGKRFHLRSQSRPGLLEDSLEKLPIILKFLPGECRIDNGLDSQAFKISDCEFLFLPDFDSDEIGCRGKCGGCSMC